MSPETEGLRLDKWLWAARLFKTRSLAVQAIERGRISVNGQAVKPARELRVGDLLALRQDLGPPRMVVVLGLTTIRGPAPVAQALYEETAQSLAARQASAEARRLVAEPALSIEHGRPSKRDRRDLERKQIEWQRWSASIDKGR